MTRKKFIKMLMGAGMQRNDAADCAQLAQEAGRAYFPVLGDLLNYHLQHFKRPAIYIMWLRIRGTIIHGANTEPWRFFRNIDEMHEYPCDIGLQQAEAEARKTIATVSLNTMALAGAAVNAAQIMGDFLSKKLHIRGRQA